MKFAVIIFPGSNCDQDCIHVLKNVFNQDVVEVFHTDAELPKGTECVVLPGGFTYGDYLRSGSIARFANIIPAVVGFANSGGLVIGICNGFQILCEIGLLPGALTRNKSLSFICDEVYLKVVNNKTPFTGLYKENEIIKLPIAHGDGRYVSDVVDESKIVFKYCDKDGNVMEEHNPNGSILNIAGIVANPPILKSSNFNILGMMPHPERVCEDLLGLPDGKRLFESLINSKVAC